MTATNTVELDLFSSMHRVCVICTSIFAASVLISTQYYRFDLWIASGCLTLTLLVIGLFASFKNEKNETISHPRQNVPTLLASLILLFFFIFSIWPVISAMPSILQNQGPDFDGHLISASFLMQGGRISNIEELYSSDSFHWTSEVSAWDHPDFSTAIAYEFMVRSMRWGHSAFTAVGSSTLGLHLPTFLQISCILALCCCVCFFTASASKSITSFLFASLFAFSNNHVVQLAEGITAQVFAMPLILSAFVCSRQLIFLCKVNEKITSTKFIEIWIYTSINLLALLVSFTEGLLVFVLFLMPFVFLRIILPITSLKKKVFYTSLKKAFYSIVIISLLILLIDIMAVVRMLEWLPFRLASSFSGGALHYNWDLHAVLFGIQPILAAGGKLIVNFTLWPLVIFFWIVAICSLVFASDRANVFSCIFATIIVLVFFEINGHAYSGWKAAVIISPIFFLSLSDAFRSSKYNSKYSKSAAVGTFTFLICLLGYAAWNTENTKRSYEDHKYVAALPFFTTPVGIPNHDFAFIVEPEINHGFNVFKLSAFHKLYWLESGWGPNFAKFKKTELPVYYLENNQEVGMLYYCFTGKTVAAFLDENGMTDHNSLREFVASGPCDKDF